MLRIEVVVHSTQELQCGHSLEKFPRILVQAKDILERFMDALSCIDQCFIAERMLEELPTPSSVGKTKVGGIDLNKARMSKKASSITNRNSDSNASNGLKKEAQSLNLQLVATQ